MTDAAQFIRDHGRDPVEFAGYYKYSFYYTCGDEYTVKVGGGDSNIYRSDLHADMPLWLLLKETSTEYAYVSIGDERIDLDTPEAWQAVLEFWRESRNV